jgi:hypothetical protein
MATRESNDPLEENFRKFISVYLRSQRSRRVKLGRVDRLAMVAKRVVSPRHRESTTKGRMA